MVCPECGDSDNIYVRASVWCRVTKEGNDNAPILDTDYCLPGDFSWNRIKSDAFCGECGNGRSAAYLNPERFDKLKRGDRKKE